MIYLEKCKDVTSERSGHSSKRRTQKGRRKRTYNDYTIKRHIQLYKVSSYTSHGTTVVKLSAESVTRSVSDKDKVN